MSGLAGRRVAVRSGRILEAVVAGRGAQVLLEGDAASGTHRVIRIKAPLTLNSRREVQRPRGRKENKALRARARTSERRLSRFAAPMLLKAEALKAPNSENSADGSGRRGARRKRQLHSWWGTRRVFSFSLVYTPASQPAASVYMQPLQHYTLQHTRGEHFERLVQLLAALARRGSLSHAQHTSTCRLWGVYHNKKIPAAALIMIGAAGAGPAAAAPASASTFNAQQGSSLSTTLPFITV